jgi:hypothetical protein
MPCDFQATSTGGQPELKNGCASGHSFGYRQSLGLSPCKSPLIAPYSCARSEPINQKRISLCRSVRERRSRFRVRCKKRICLAEWLVSAFPHIRFLKAVELHYCAYRDESVLPRPFRGVAAQRVPVLFLQGHHSGWRE